MLFGNIYIKFKESGLLKSDHPLFLGNSHFWGSSLVLFSYPQPGKESAI